MNCENCKKLTGGLCEKCLKEQDDNFMNQTNNIIREEIINKLQNEWGVDNRESDSFDNWVADLLLSKIEELLKSQREDLVEKIEKISDFADSGDTLKSRIINLIKERLT